MKKIQFTDGIENICAIQKLVGCVVMVGKPNTEHAVLCSLDGKIIAHLGDYIVKDKNKVYVLKQQQ
jgi:hypothetical protein